MTKSQTLSPEEDERIIGISAGVAFSALFGGFFYLFYLYVNDIIEYTQGIIYSFLILYPLFIGLWVGAYEILSSRRIKKPLQSHIRRFTSRVIILSSYGLMLAGFWSLYSRLLSELISSGYILLLAVLTSSVTLAALATVPRTRRVINKYIKSE